MRTIRYIGFSALAGIGIGVALSRLFVGKQESGCGCGNEEDEEVKKVFDSDENDPYDAGAISLVPDRKPEPILSKDQKVPAVIRITEGLKKRRGVRSRSMAPELSKSLLPMEDWYGWLRKEYDVMQVRLTNTSAQEKTISLWGANSGVSISPPSIWDVQDHQVVAHGQVPLNLGGGIHPQGLAVNPTNGFVYVANQLTNDVSVLTAGGQLIALIPLKPSVLPGTNSPVSVAVNTDPASASYGKVYVVGSIANTVSVIEHDFTVSSEIPVGARPSDIAFNPVNGMLYVTNLAGNDITVIDTVTEDVVTTLPCGLAPLGVGVNPENGDVYVANSQDATVSVFNQGNTLVTTLMGVGNKPVGVVYYPPADRMYVIATGNDSIYPVHSGNYAVGAPTQVGGQPYPAVYNPNNGYLYIGNRQSGTLSVMDSSENIIATVPVGHISTGLDFSPAENLLFISDTAANAVSIIGYADMSSSISVDNGFAAKTKDFQHNPALVKHVKFVLSGTERFGVLTVREKTITGTMKDTPVSFRSHDSPQNYLNVAEVFELDGAVLDGKHSWLFKIAAHQTITVLVYYLQSNADTLIPEEKQVIIKQKRA